MDWKNNIVAEPGCQEAAKAFLPYATEEFLVTFSNKGLYKRAIKDLETVVTIKITKINERLQITLNDTIITLADNINLSTCSCPSKTVCKHIVMGILCIAEYAGTCHKEPGKSPKEPSPWQELKEVDITDLRKQAGKKLFDNVYQLIQNGWTADLIEKEMLEANINTDNVIVYFPRQNSLQNAVCQCGNKGICKHKLIAVLSYLNSLDKKTLLENVNQFSSITDNVLTLLTSADKFITHLLEKGIICCGENEIESAIHYSVRIETCGIGNVARLFRSLASDLENMLNKHISFNQNTTFSTLSRLHNTLRLVLSNRHDSNLLNQLIERTRSHYYSIAKGNFIGLGACPWQTRSGYFGITVYFFYEEKQTICTYTAGMADYYERTEYLANIKNLSTEYTKGKHWDINTSLAQLSCSKLTLRNFKLNSQNRLSSSMQTQCELTGEVNLQTLQMLAELPCFINISRETKICYSYFQKRQLPRLILILFTQIVDSKFNRTEQKLYLILKQESEYTEVTIPYNKMSQYAITYLERLSHSKKHKPRYMQCLTGEDGLIPISMTDQKSINNFYFQIEK